MDLLGDLGQHDQLTATRAENAALHAKVKELTSALKQLKLDKIILQAEVDVYKREAEKVSESLNLVKQVSIKGTLLVDEEDDFIKMGNGMFCKEAAVTLENIHGNCNPLSCALNGDDTLVATGGADSYLRLFKWGMALAPYDNALEETMNKSKKISFSTPIICTAFSRYSRSGSGLIATGGMDGSVNIVRYSDEEMEVLESNVKHGKYIKSLQWSPKKYGNTSLLASSSADGGLFLSKIDEDTLNVYSMEQLRFDGPVEAMCFLDHGSILCVHARGTTYLSYFDIDQDCKQKKYMLNASAFNDEHVSFTVLSLVPSPCGKYIAAATDASRNIILDAKTCRQVRNLYGHVNDGYSTPKIGWSSNSQYLYGNTQDETSICVWDISSSSIVKKIQGHDAQIRDLCSSALSDTLVTVSYDKTAKIWLPPFE